MAALTVHKKIFVDSALNILSQAKDASKIARFNINMQRYSKYYWEKYPQKGNKIPLKGQKSLRN